VIQIEVKEGWGMAIRSAFRRDGKGMLQAGGKEIQ
jgi:hypothetical protein